ncbi:MAG: NAD(P)H-dependent oxidoreductase subunit E, partial [Hyphomicrobiales bacterium]
MLCGSEDLKEVCREMIGDQMHVTEDGTFSWIEVECLGACCNAPMVQINKDYYEDLTPESFRALLEDLKAGKDVKPGPQNGRHTSEPLGGLTSLFGSDGAPKKKTSAAPKKVAASKKKAAPDKKAADTKAEPAKGASEARPKGLDAARDGKADDLKMISGVGPKIEGILNELGVFHFDQIAAWKKNERDWVDTYLKFKGRIERDEWLKQAKVLAEGGAEEYERVFGKKP